MVLRRKKNITEFLSAKKPQFTYGRKREREIERRTVQNVKLKVTNDDHSKEISLHKNQHFNKKLTKKFVSVRLILLSLNNISSTDNFSVLLSQEIQRRSPGAESSKGLHFLLRFKKALEKKLLDEKDFTPLPHGTARCPIIPPYWHGIRDRSKFTGLLGRVLGIFSENSS